MKIWLLTLAAAALCSLASCTKEEDAAPPFDAEPSIQDYLRDNNLTDAVRTASGLYYVVENSGSAARATLDSLVTFTYTAKLTDGTQVSDPRLATNPSYRILASTLPSLQEGLQLIGPGGRIKIISPPELAYGSQGNPPVPGDSVVIFDVGLISFTPESANIIEAYLGSEGIDNSETTASGLTYIIHEPGDTTNRPAADSNVEAIYVGSYLNGAIFDDSNGAPRRFSLTQVIKGWTEGLPLVGEGGSITLVIPYELAYGAAGQTDNQGRVITPPYSVLRFDIDLVGIF